MLASTSIWGLGHRTLNCDPGSYLWILWSRSGSCGFEVKGSGIWESQSSVGFARDGLGTFDASSVGGWSLPGFVFGFGFGGGWGI